ncbi:MAG: hypothetical protein H6711_04495 [Myxococcales bacterium]|nr:hypothetical protein [Myxococcales bacterium]
MNLRPEPRRWRPLVLFGGGLATALAAAASWLLLVGPRAELAPPEEAPRVAVAEGDAEVERAAGSEGLRLLRGAATAGEGGTPLAAGARLEAGSSLALADGACVGVTALFEGCARGPASLRIRGAAIAVEGGALAFEASAPAASIVWVEVAGAVIRSDAPGAFALVVEVDHWELRAERGEVLVRLEGEGEAERRLGAGEVLRIPPATPEDEDAADEAGEGEGEGDAGASTGDAAIGVGSRARPAGDPRALLAEAQALRGAADYRGAARVYRRLIREEGGRTSLARTAQVALGQLYLGPLGDPARALRAFDAYLRGAAEGAMAEEALYGKIEALRRLGREEAAAEASAEFLRRFPRSSYAAKLRGRGGG